MLTKIPGVSDDYLPRHLGEELRELFPRLPAIAIDDAKGVGKTETTRRWIEHVLALGSPEMGQLIAADIVNQLIKYITACTDEWQKYPPVWDAVRRFMDQQTPNRFLLTGGTAPVSGVDAHSGAGRIASLRLRPLSLAGRPNTNPSVFTSRLFLDNAEVSGETNSGLLDYVKAICETGVPQILRASPCARRILIDDYIQHTIDHDIPEQGVLMHRPQDLRAWMSACAVASSTTVSYSAILDAASPEKPGKPTKSTTQSIRESLIQLWILDPVPNQTSTGTFLKRLTFGPKHQLFDPDIAAALIGTTLETLLSSSPGSMKTFGQLFEALTTLTVRAARQAAEAKYYHPRTRAGEHEIDLILECYDGEVTAFGVKLATTMNENDLKHLYWLGKRVGKRLVERIVVTTGQFAFRRPDGIAIIPLALLR